MPLEYRAGLDDVLEIDTIRAAVRVRLDVPDPPAVLVPSLRLGLVMMMLMGVCPSVHLGDVRRRHRLLENEVAVQLEEIVDQLLILPVLGTDDGVVAHFFSVGRVRKGYRVAQCS